MFPNRVALIPECRVWCNLHEELEIHLTSGASTCNEAGPSTATFDSKFVLGYSPAPVPPSVT